MTDTEFTIEIIKISLGVLTPLAIVFLGIWVQRIAKRIEQSHWINRTIIEKRMEIYEKVAPKLNDWLCYFCYIGAWRMVPPTEIIDSKRDLDKEMYLSAILFSDKLLPLYNSLTDLCFETYRGWGCPPLLRSAYERREEAFEGRWEFNWDQHFSQGKEITDPKFIQEAYTELMKQFARELGLGLDYTVTPGYIPGNIR